MLLCYVPNTKVVLGPTIPAAAERVTLLIQEGHPHIFISLFFFSCCVSFPLICQINGPSFICFRASPDTEMLLNIVFVGPW